MILFTFVQLVLLFPGLYVAAGAGVRLATGVANPRLVVPDHGFVRHNQIDDFYPEMPRDMVLIGITSFSSCCSRNFTADGKEIGWWFYPNGTEVPKFQNETAVWDFFTSRYRKDVFLFRRRGGANGIHRLDIPVSATKNETFYVGLYPSADSGNPRVTSMHLNLASEYTVGETPKFSLTCSSVGGPATNVTWTRDGVAVSGGNFTATRRLDNPVTAAYTLTLSVTGRQGGVYRCQVAKSGPGVSGDPVNSHKELEVKVASPPTNFIAEQVNETTVRISWTPTASEESVTGYRIHYMAADSQGTRGEFMTAPVTNRRFIHNLQAGIYSFTMVALSEHLPSEVVGPIPVIIKAVPAITVTTVEVTTTSIWVQWSGVNSVNQPDSLEIAFQYTMGSLYNGFCSDYQHSVIVTLTNGSTHQYNITGLQEHSTYSITIVAENAAGKSAPSEAVITTLQAVPSGTPREITRVNTTSTEITLHWREVPCIDRNGGIIGYTVRYSISGSNITLRNYSDTVATLVDLIPFTNYSIEIAAFNVNGTGPFSTPVYMRTDDDTPSGTPQEVTILDTTSTEITLQWREVPCVERNGDIIGYTVRYSISGSIITLRNYSDTVATLVELTPFSIYSIEVAAFNVNGTGPFSTPVYVRTDRDKPMDSAPIIIGVVFSVIAAAIIIMILTIVGVAKHRVPKATSSQEDARDTAAKTECVAFESAGSENSQAGEYEVPMKQCTAYGVI